MTSKEALKFFVKNIDCDVYEFDLDEVIKHKRCLEQDLERLEKFAHENASLHTEIDSLHTENEKLKKVIELLEHKSINTLQLRYSKNVEAYNEWASKYYQLTQEEYELLKEYL